MRLLQSPAEAAFLSTILFPFLTAAVGNFGCGDVRADGVNFNFKELDGPRSVLTSVEHHLGDETTFTNTTYMIDICKPLTKTKFNKCPNGSRVCAITHLINPTKGIDDEVSVVPYAGDFDSGSGALNAKWELLSRSKSHEDSKKEGLRVEFNGGANDQKRPLKTIIEFTCDKNRTGLEGLWDPEAHYKDNSAGKENPAEEQIKTKEDEAKEGEGVCMPSLEFVRLDVGNGDADILRLQWKTKHACEKAVEEAEPKASWGFFTWFILIAFLSTAAYLIFGSWLNYNRYGARGWDLLPHGDAIRDVPYLLKDWVRRVLSSIQGGGSRGGYAAV